MGFFLGRRRLTDVESAANKLHDDLVAATRQPIFYQLAGVPDTFEGRFDLLVLHAALVLRRLNAVGGEANALAQNVVDTMFSRFDMALRELGVSDIGVPKRMKRLAEAFRGRTAAYDEALTQGDRVALANAISRNILNDASDGQALALYALAVEERLRSADLAAFRSGLPLLPDPAQVLSDASGDR